MIQSKKIIEKEYERITKIESIRLDRRNLLEKDELELTQIKNESLEADKKIDYYSLLIKKGELELSNTFDSKKLTATEQQILNAKNELDKLEDKAFDLLETLEVLEKNIQESHTFLKGSQETILEIEAEVNLCNNGIMDEIKKYERRLEALYEELPVKVVEKIKSLIFIEKKIYPLSEIKETNNCTRCGYLIPRALIDSIEIKMKFHSCPGCTRILIPQNTKLY